MKYLLTITTALSLLFLATRPVFAQGAGSEWDSLNQEVVELYSAGDYGGAVVVAKKALEVAEKNVDLHHPAVATSLNNLVLTYNPEGQVWPKVLYGHALAIFEKAVVVTSLNNLAVLYRTQGRYAQAEPLYQRALAITEKGLGLDHPAVAASLAHLAGLYRTQGQYAQAEPLYERALAIREKTLGPDDPVVAWGLNNLAELYRTQGQYAQAEPLYQRALAIFEKALLRPDHPAVAATRENLAALYRATNRDEEAETLKERAARPRALQR